MKLALPKTIKNDLGAEVFHSSVRCLKLVIVANGSEIKGKVLRELALEVEVQWVYLRLLHDLKAISTGQFEELCKRLVEISPQITAWMAWDKKQQKAATAVPKKT